MDRHRTPRHNGSLIEHHRFHHPDDAEAFYKEHRAEGENWVEYPPYEEKEGT